MKAWPALLIVAAVLPSNVVLAQEAERITGIVTSQAGQPLAGASVAVSGTQVGVVTGPDGRYVITGIAPGTHELQVNLLGYAPDTVTVTLTAGQATTADFQLDAQAISLNEIVAVGYGQQRRAEVTGSVAAVAPAELEKRPVANITEALQGVAPGLTVIDHGGRPGDDDSMFFIRGRGSVNNTDPLVLIDGVRGDINVLDPQDIESISVLKDAASAAIYGARAANGVILVTTKRGGSTGTLRFSYDAFYGLQEVQTFPEIVGPEMYLRLANEAYVNAGRPPRYSEEYIENTVKAYNGNPSVDPLQYPFTNWLDVLFDPAPIQDHTLSLRGGNDLASFSLSLNYMDQEGMIPNTAADRYSIRLNSDFQPTERLHAALDLALRRTSDVEPNAMGDVLFRMFHDTPPFVVPKYPDGTYGFSDKGHNPLAYAEAWGTRERKYLHGLINAKADYTLAEGLTIRGLASVQGGSWNYNDWRNELSFFDYWDPTRPSRSPVTPNRLEQRKSNDVETYLRAMLELNRSFGDHDLGIMVGYDQTHRDWEEIRVIREGFHSNDLREINVGDAAREDTWGTSYDWSLRSGFGRVRYSWQSKYLLEANARYDGSSRFAEGRRFGFFPSFSAGWRVSEESFVRDNLGFITELKLRASWGRVGNQNVQNQDGDQLYYPYYSPIILGGEDIDYVFGEELVNGAAKSALANESISWETSTMTDIGIDLAMLDGRLWFTGDLYWKDTEDILRQLPIPGIVGLDAPIQNALKLKNTGWETTIGWRDVLGELDYSIDLQVASNTNEVTDLVGTGPYIDGLWLIQEGQPLGTMYGFVSDGLFRDQAEVDSHAQQFPGTGPGDIKYRDLSGPEGVPDGVVDATYDRVPIGVDMPKYTFGSSWQATWRNFDASVFFQGALSFDYFLTGALVEGPYWENLTTTAWLDRWTPDNLDGRMPKPTLNVTRNHQASDYWVWDASYIKVKNAQIGYTLPASLLGRLNVDRLRVYVSGQNLFTFTEQDLVLDPEAPSGRGNVYPPTRTLSFGVSAQF